MSHPARNTSFVLYLIAAVIGAAIFAVDLFSPLGAAQWILYIVTVALCMFGRDRHAPLAAAAIATLLLVIGYFLSPASYAAGFSVFNRSVGVLTLWIVGAVAYQYIGSREALRNQAWLTQGQMRLALVMRGEHAPESIGANMLRTLVSYVDASVATLYTLDDGRLRRLASWALPETAKVPAELELGRGLAGQAAADGAIVQVKGLSPDYLQIGSSLGSTAPVHVVAAPITAAGEVVGVVELGFTDATDDLDEIRELIELSAESMGMAIRSALYRFQLENLLAETQRQSEELQVQQEELRVSNEELEERGRALMESQSRLETQQADLEQANIQLEEHTQDLERQKQELLSVQQALAANAIELEAANRYKSEFLANMSHELRTPLNSSLILSKLLVENKDGNLTSEQVRYASTIYSSNADLLTLINDILDLSRLEAGHVDVDFELVEIKVVLGSLEQIFEPIAADKALNFRIERLETLPESFISDNQRVQQILRNLLANAFKFTHSGEVVLRVSGTGESVRFDVKDTGIGIPAEQQQAVFDAFRQADGTTRRRYGGSGLGLSISREFAQMLGGHLELVSEPGSGSVFSLILPLKPPEQEQGATQPPQQQAEPVDAARRHGRNSVDHLAEPHVTTRPRMESVAPIKPDAGAEPVSAGLAAADEPAKGFPDDRFDRKQGTRLILVIEDDHAFARILYDLAHELEFDCIHASTALEGVALAREFQPCGILLDMGLPDNSGLVVLEQLKRDPATRHIPIHVVSVADHTETALHLGAIGYTLKPAARARMAEAIEALKARFDQDMRRILVVEDDPALRENIGLLLSTDDVEITGAGTLADAERELAENHFDCVVMDLSLPDGSGYDLIETMAERGRDVMPPVIVYTGKSLSSEDERRLRKYSRSIIIKGARSPERLLDEVTLFLHSVEADLPPDRQRMLKEVRQRDAAFEGRTILLAEDDIRNIFALSQVIEPLGAKLEIARNGREAVNRVASGADIDLVLMDIMMPEMDGLTATQEIRKLDNAGRLPIIALTAKAMASDRQRCLDAGANDYISKPIDVDKLLSLCRVWLPHR